MAKYASFNDMIDILGRDEVITLTDKSGTDEPDSALAEKHLALACSEADAYLGKRYTLPLSSTPAILMSKVLDIASYSLARSSNLITDDIKDRYKVATTFLRDLSSGKATLGIDEPKDTASAGDAGSSSAVLFDVPDDLVMTRANLKGM
ncbi:MAG: DUF1320 domain-containing protein [Cohaesibacter sp.]|nr:DUF1320 domain-containing protein [Cohaesibacter sp.]